MRGGNHLAVVPGAKQVKGFREPLALEWRGHDAHRSVVRAPILGLQWSSSELIANLRGAPPWQGRRVRFGRGRGCPTSRGAFSAIPLLIRFTTSPQSRVFNG